MAAPPKKHRGKKILITITVLFSLLLVGLYYLVQSPAFLRWAVDQLNRTISGEVSYQEFDLSLEHRSLRIRDLAYENDQGEQILSIEELDLAFSLKSAIQGHLAIRSLGVRGLTIDQAKEKEKLVPSRWRTVLRLILKRVSIEDAKLAEIQINLQNGDKFYFSSGELDLSPQRLSKQKVHLVMNGALIQPADITIRAESLEFFGDVEFPVLRDFPFLVSEAKGSFDLKGVEIGGLPPSEFSADFKIGGESLYLMDGNFKNANTSLAVNIDYTPKKSLYKVNLKTLQTTSFAAIPKVSERLVETFNGMDFELDAEVAGYRLSEMNGDVALRAKAYGNRSHDNTPDYELTMAGNLKSGKLSLKQFEIDSAGMSLTAKGSVDFAKQLLDVGIQAEDFDLTTLINAIADLDLTGDSHAEGTIKGPFKNPNFIFTAKAEKTGYSFMNFGKVSGEFKIIDGLMTFVGGSPEGTPYQTQVQVKTTDLFKKERRRTDLTAEFTNLEATDLLENPEMKGKVSGTYEMEALPGSVERGTLQAKIDDFVVYDFYFDQIETTGKLENNQFILNPLVVKPTDYDPITISDAVVFKFDDRGWTVQGPLLPGMTLDGKYQKSSPNYVDVSAKFTDLDLKPVLASMQLPQRESQADGEVKMKLGIDDNPSSIDLKFTKLEVPIEDEDQLVKNDGEILIEIRPPKVNFKSVGLAVGEEKFSMTGSYTLDGPIDLNLDGNLDLGILEFLPQYFRAGQGFAKLDLKVDGTYENPNLNGTVSFDNAGVTLRPIRGEVENLSGTIRFSPQAVNFEKLSGTMREGDLIINGPISLQGGKPSYYDLEISTREVAVAEPGVYKIIFSGEFSLKGPADSATLGGTMDINDGVYSRDFSITQSFLKPEVSSIQKDKTDLFKNIKLDLNVRSPGELAVKNNVARIFFNADLKVTGTTSDPKFSGALEVLDGKLHYFTVDFESARGSIDFRDPKKGPYVDLTFQKTYQTSFDTTTVDVQIQGFTDNLQMQFFSNPPLERRDIMALVFTGVLPGDAQNRLSGGNLASTVIASQISQVIQRPLEQKARLDIFRLEASDPSSNTFSSLVVGKKLTDRLSLEFKTDLGVDRPQQGVQMEYRLLDNILVKATQFNDGTFDFNLALRFLLF